MVRRVPRVYEGFDDVYHGLTVGPCDREAIEAEAGCPLVREVGELSEGQFDCSYSEWVGLFRKATLLAAEKGWPEAPAGSEGSPHPVSRQVPGPIAIDGEHRLERRGEGWCVADDSGSCLMYSPAEPSWGDPQQFPEDLLTFASPQEALSAALLALGVQEARREHRRAAFRMLGRPDPDE